MKADESIPFYNPAVASVLDLPFPPEQVSLADLRARGVLGLRADGFRPPGRATTRPRSRDERPSPTLSTFAPPKELSNPS